MKLKVEWFGIGVWSVNTKQTLLILSFFHTLQYVICYSSAHPNQDETGREIPNITSNSHVRTWDISPSDKNVDLYTSLIDILEKLDIVEIDENSSACITLGRIVREVETVKSSDISNVKVTFHFVETLHSTESQDSAQHKNPIPDTQIPAYSVGGLKSPRCNKSSKFLALGLDSLSRKQDSGANSVLEVAKDKDSNKTGAIPMKDQDEETDEKGLSRTQIVVISTCSAVIGLFFLIAGALRIRNYYKRYISRRENNLNANRRGSSLRLPSSTNSSGNLRRDSSCSKASRQSHTTVKSGGDSQIARQEKLSLFPHPSPTLATTDQRPLLPAHSPLSQNSNGSSHGSIAYIDEDSSSRIKTSDLNEDGSDANEDFPLLKKSPDSGSYVSLVIESDKENKQKSATGTYDFNEEGNKQNDSDKTKEFERDEYSDIGDRTVYSDSFDMDQNSRLDDVSKDELTTDDMRMPSEQGSIADIVDIINSEGTGLNKFDVDNQNISGSYVVNVGLNQSCSSISENPSYCYGNQCEYSPNTDLEYEYYYFQDSDWKEFKLMLDSQDDSQQISSLLENEKDYRENGSYDRVTNQMSDMQLNYVDSKGERSSLEKSRVSDISDDTLSGNNMRKAASLDNNFSELTEGSIDSLAVVPHQPVIVAENQIT